MRDPQQVVFPKSYKHLCSLAQRGVQLECDCKKSHISKFGLFILVLFSANFIVSSLVCLANQSWLLSHTSLDRIYLAISIGILGLVIGTMPRLLRRGWMKAHPDKVFRELIPNYLQQQIYLMGENLCNLDKSRFGVMMSRVEQVVTKAGEKQRIILQFAVEQGGMEKLPSHFIPMLIEAEDCLKFREAQHLLWDTQVLVAAFLGSKLDEVKKLKNSCPAFSADTYNIKYWLWQDVWLREAQVICESLNELSANFNRYLEESYVLELGSDKALSTEPRKMVEVARVRANSLLVKLKSFFSGLETTKELFAALMKEEPPKPGENKAGEPFVEDGKLTKAGLAELDELEQNLEREGGLND